MYDAFISYSHAADGKLAPALQQGLQSFAKPWYRRRALRIFRDQTSLAASPELWPTIVKGLENARYFVLLASPEAAASRWVGREVAWWREHRSPQTMLVVLTSGELAWDEAAGDFDWAKTNALPEELRDAFPSEPLWVDLRWAKSETDISVKHPDFSAAVADLAATIRGVSKEDLVGEDIRQHRRTRLTAAAAIAALALLALAAAGAGVVALGQRNEARYQERVAEAQAATAEAERSIAVDARATAEAERAIAVSRQLASQARLLQDEHYDTALLLAVEATYQSPSVESRQSLLSLLGARIDMDRYLWNPNGLRNVVTFTTDGTRLVSASSSGVELWDLERDHVFASIEDSPTAYQGTVAAVSPDGELLAIGGCSIVRPEGGCDRGSIQFLAADTLAPLTDPIPAHNNEVDTLVFNADGTRLATASWPGTVHLWDVPGRRLLAGFPSGLETGIGDFSLAFSLDGSRLAVAGPNASNAVGGVGIRVWDVTDDHPRPGPYLEHDRGVVDITFSDDGSRLVGGSQTGLFAWNLDGASSLPTPLLENVNVTGLALHRPSGVLYAVDLDGTTHVLDFASGEVFGSVTDGQGTSGAMDVAVSPDGLNLAVQAGPAIALWDWGRSDPRRELPISATADLTISGWPATNTIRVIEDNQRVVDITAAMGNGALTETVPVLDAPAPSNDEASVVAASGSTIAWAIAGESTITVVGNSNASPREITADAGVRSLALTPDGALLVAILDDDTVRAWDARDLSAIASANPFGTGEPSLPDLGFRLVVSASGTRLAVTSSIGDQIAVLTLPSLQLALPPFALVPLTWGTLAMTFTSDDRSLIVAGHSGARGDDPLIQRQSNLTRWDLTGEVAVGMVLADGFGPGGVATSSDGRLLAYTRAYYDQVDVYLWDLEHSVDLGWLGRQDRAAELVFSPDGKRLAVGSTGFAWDGTMFTPRLVVYEVDLDVWRAVACRVAARELTPEEWQFYLGDAGQTRACAAPSVIASTDAA